MKKIISIEGKTLVMGVLNVTPDSFSDGGRYNNVSDAVKHAKKMLAEGADIIDVGGESSRPGSDPLPEEDELSRVKPVVEALAAEINVPISIDTCKPGVARQCIEAGASMINDITGLGNDMREVAAQYSVPAVIMHMSGTPKTMQENISYTDLVTDIIEYLRERIEYGREAGVPQLIVDPGIGFGKTTEHNLEIIRRLGEFKTLGCPILVGPSRKSFIGDVTGLPVEERLEGTIAAVVAAILYGADIVRVHDVREGVRAAKIADAIKNA